MDKASLYRESNAKPRSTSEELIKEFGNKIQWRRDGNNSLIDIGCGCGDVTTEVILPLLPSNFSRVVGADKSLEMIAYAKKHYSQPKVKYEVLDISGDIQEFLTLNEPFDHLTSFYCLQRVQNQKKAAENIFKLLQPDGDFLLWQLANGSMYDAYEVLSKNKKWAEYLKDYEEFLTPYKRSSNAIEEFAEALREVGFNDFHIEIRNFDAKFEDVNEIKKLMTALDPFVNRIPTKIQDEYMNDSINELKLDQFNYIMRVQVLVAYGRKSIF